MKRGSLFLTLFGVVCFVLPTPVRAQMGMDLFKPPAITKVFHPVVGKGAVYQDTSKDSKPRTMELSIVGKDTVDGKAAYWMEVYSSSEEGKSVLGKSLITPEDFQIHRMIIQPEGKQAMEMPMHMNAARQQKMQDNFNDWHSVGTESITVPAGTFSCEHWHNDKTNSDVWTSDKVVPFGMVKSVSSHGGTEVLVKVIDNATDRITGPVKQFDMQEMMQEMQQRRQQSPQ